MKDEYTDRLAQIAGFLAEATQELCIAIGYHAQGLKTLNVDAEERAWKALDIALQIKKENKPFKLVNEDIMRKYDEARAKLAKKAFQLSETEKTDRR